jgi:N-acetyl-D-muramate 6-phosphate phosphatase
MTIKAVFFDLDGTLVDTAPDFVATVNQLAREYQLALVDEEVIRTSVSDGSQALVKLTFDIDECHPDFNSRHQRLLTIYNAHMGNHCRLFPGMENILMALKQQQLPWGIITNKPLCFSEPLMARLALRYPPCLLLCPDHVSLPKPDPEAIYLACRHLSCNADEIIYIGDHHRDIVCGNRAGSTTIAAAYGYIKPNEPVDQWQADYIANSVSDIWPIIEKIARL